MTGEPLKGKVIELGKGEMIWQYTKVFTVQSVKFAAEWLREQVREEIVNFSVRAGGIGKPPGGGLNVLSLKIQGRITEAFEDAMK